MIQVSSSTIFTVFRLITEGVAATLPLCVLLLRPGLMDKFVAYYDKYREPIADAGGPQHKRNLSALV